MRSKAIFMAMLVLSFAVQAEPVSSDDAMVIAESWVARAQNLEPNIGKLAKAATRYEADDGAAFYAVEMYGGGTVYVTADTEMLPVFAFSSGTADAKALSKDGPLWAFLSRNVSLRQKVLDPLSYAAGPTAKAANQLQAMSSNAEEWQELAMSAGSLEMAAAAEKYNPLKGEPKDLRVADLMKSNWAQGGAMAMFTPYGSVCGCVATAIAQVMRYLHVSTTNEFGAGLGIPFPLEKINIDTSFPTKYADKSYPLKMAGADEKGAPYDWENMPAVLANAMSDVQKTAVGRLASDVGIMVSMSYSTGGRNQSSASTSDGPKQLVNVMGYKQAFWYQPASEEEVTSTDAIGILPHTIFANADAQRPCLMSVPGHAVVATGYGYENDRPYVCVNFGWGQPETWCNLPTLGTVTDVLHDAVTGIGYNIFPEVGGMVSKGKIPYGIISGRVLDAFGEPVEGVSVSVYKAGTLESATTNAIASRAHGVWAAILPPGSYDVSVIDKATGLSGSLSGVVLESPRASGFTVYAGALGNSWGNDVVLNCAAVRVADTYVATIDSAVLLARSIAATNGNETVRIEVLGETMMSASQTIDFACEIVATNDNPSISPITRLNDAAFAVVTTNGFLSVSNLVFTGSSETVIVADSNGVTSVAGLVDFGVLPETAAVQTETASGLLFAAPLERGFTLDCRAATNASECCALGRAVTPSAFEAFTNDAVRISNFYDLNGEMRGQVKGKPDNYEVVWCLAPVPFEEAAGFYTDKNGATNTAANLDRLIENYEVARQGGSLDDSCRIELLRGGRLTRPLRVTGDLKLIGVNDLIIDFDGASGAGFELTNGTLTVSGLTFTNYLGNAIFLVNGETAALKLEDTLFADIRGTNCWSGAVAVQRGSVGTTDTRFESCRIDKKDDASRKLTKFNGGALFLGGEGCVATLGDGTIMTNCFAYKYGAAVYAGKGAAVHLAGHLKIFGNLAYGDSGSVLSKNDIYLVADVKTALVVDAAVSGAVGVRWSTDSKATGYGNKEGCWLASADSEAVARESQDAFVNDATASLMAETEETETSGVFGLKWKSSPVGPQPLPAGREGEASARVTYKDSSVAYYLLTYEAIEAATRDATIEIIGTNGNYLAKDLVVTNGLTFSSTNANWTFVRTADCSLRILSGGSLTVKDLAFKSNGTTTQPLFDVAGGSLTLATPSEGRETSVTEVKGSSRNGGAVNVWQGGTFTMESGATIKDCAVVSPSLSVEATHGGAVLAENGIVNLCGGTITECKADSGAGVFIGSAAKLNVSGDLTLFGNIPDNLLVHAEGQLLLTAPLTGKVGYTEGYGGDSEVFGRVAESFVGTVSNMVESAHCFTNVFTRDIGTIVSTNGTNLLVWASAVRADGTYVAKDGTVYTQPSGPDIPQPERPESVVHPTAIAFQSISRGEGNVWNLVITNRVKSCYYRLIYTEDLSKGFTTTGVWEQATASGEWNTNIMTTGNGTYYWKAEAIDSSPAPTPEL